MAKSDQLFLLIKALTKQEKRHFKLSMSKYQSNGSKDYLRLFDAIDAQKVYDEKAIRKKFQNEAYFSQLSSVKTYLHRQIMKSLRGFYDDTTSNIKLNNYLTEIEFLYKKELFRNCLMTIKKAKAYAEKYEKLSDILKIIEWETKVADRTNDLQKVRVLKHKAIAEAKDIVAKFKEITELRKIYLESYKLIQVTGGARTQPENAKHDHIVQHPLIDRKIKSFHGELLRLTIKAHKEQFRIDYGSVAEIKKMIELYDANPHQIDEYINVYFNNLIQICGVSILTRKYLSAEMYMQKLRNIYRKKYDELAITRKLRLLYMEIYLLLDKGEFKRALGIIPDITSLIGNDLGELGGAEAVFFNHICIDVYFKNKDYKRAQQHIQKMMSHEDENRLDMQSSARVINLVIQYELKEYEHLGYMLRSVCRYLMKKQQLYEAEVIILDFIKKALKFNSEKQIVHALAELKEQLLPHQKEPFVRIFSLIEWIESKLHKRDLQDIVKDRYTHAVIKEQAEMAMAAG